MDERWPNLNHLYPTRFPWENGHIESFHNKLRDECLNREIIGSLLEAKVLVEQWRIEYNTNRPHSSLGYQTSQEVADHWQTTLLICPSSGVRSTSLSRTHVDCRN
ncbi:MAG: hypothetical protein B9S32_09050 [Verrucomicrobia bacterium Tous-C9LFEB]|nr:MAG: hypothetical protein B9S32_09050 [Verrucomicrobia bacterium Tous-C9LFEB]